MDECVEYLEKLLVEISNAKNKGQTGLFKMNEKIDKKTSNYILRYFESSKFYDIEMRKCNSCKIPSWDILIYFLP